MACDSSFPHKETPLLFFCLFGSDHHPFWTKKSPFYSVSHQALCGQCTFASAGIPRHEQKLHPHFVPLSRYIHTIQISSAFDWCRPPLHKAQLLVALSGRVKTLLLEAFPPYLWEHLSRHHPKSIKRGQ